MVDQFDGKGPFVDRIDLDGQNLDGSPVRTDTPRCSLDIRLELVDGTILTSDVLRLQSFSGKEGISQPFEFTLDLRADDYTFYESTPRWALIEADDGQPKLAMDDLLGSSVTVMIGLPETEEQVTKAYPEDRPVSYFNGVVFNVSMMDRGVWSITMKPRLSLLSLQSSYRIFEELTILEVISQVLADNGITHTASALLPDGSIDPDANFPIVSGLATYRTQSWLQGGETDLDFVNRLMEKAGLFFYFVHSETDHVMVLTDQNHYQQLLEPASDQGDPAEPQALRKLYLTSPTLSVDFEDTISQFSLQRSLVVKGVSTILAGKQAAWLSEDPANVAPVYRDDRLACPSLSMEKQLLVSYGASERELDIRKDQLEKQLLSAKSSFSGSSGLAEMRSGYVFALEETREVWEDYQDNEGKHAGLAEKGRDLLESKYPGRFSEARSKLGTGKRTSTPSEQDLGPIRPELQGAEMVAVSVSHTASIDGKYSNEFTAFDRFGYGKAFEASGDQDGTIVAQVCDKSGNADRSAVSTLAKVTKFVKSNVVSRFFMPKTDFVEKHQKTFSALGSGDPAYAAQGVYVQFINSDEGSTPVWVRLSDSMMTIPERGTFVMVSRARDETEIPEVSQVLDSVGSRTVMPKKYSKNTSWGDSYSTSYGDSFHVSVPNVPKTEYDTFTELVKGQQDTDQFNDVSFSESASSNYSVAESSRSVSVMGASPPDDIKVQDAVTPSVDEYVQVSRSVTYGDTFSSNEQQGNTTSVSKTLGNSESTTTTVGNTHSESTTEGNSSSNSKTFGNTESYTEQVGTQHSESTILGATFSKTDQQGDAVTVTTNTTTESVVATASSVSTSTIGDSVSNNNVEVSYSANITDISVSENVTGLSDNTNTTMLNISDNSTDLTVSQDVTLQSVTSSFTGDSVSETVGLTSTTFNNVADSQEFNMTPSGYKATVKADQPETSIQGMQVNIVVEMHITL